MVKRPHFAIAALAGAMLFCASAQALVRDQWWGEREYQLRDLLLREVAIQLAKKWTSPEGLRSFGWGRYIQLPESVNPLEQEAALEELYDRHTLAIPSDYTTFTEKMDQRMMNLANEVRRELHPSASRAASSYVTAGFRCYPWNSSRARFSASVWNDIWK
jgi:hypothetical protein